MRYRVMFARFPYKGAEHPDSTDWLVKTILEAKQNPLIEDVSFVRYDDTPITMTRNMSIAQAQKANVDFLCMLDSDMAPDYYLPANIQHHYPDSNAKPFWSSSLEFLIEQRAKGEPGMVASPYCGPPPHENVYVFHWINWESETPNKFHKLNQFGREEAARWKGIVEVAALPTGLCLIDMEILKDMKPPYFYYEWMDKTESAKVSTEDVTFTRDVSMAGFGVYCNWDAWSGHWKAKCIGKPIPLTADDMRDTFREAVIKNQRRNNKMVMVKAAKTPAKIP